MSLLEFKVNEYITLRLEEGYTVIYTKGEEFIQCKQLVLNKIKEDSIKDYQNRISELIQEAVDKPIEDLVKNLNKFYSKI